MVAYQIFGPSRVQQDVMHKLLIQSGKIGPIKFYICMRARHSYTCSCWQAVQFVTSDSAVQYFPSTYSSSLEFFYTYVSWSSLKLFIVIINCSKSIHVTIVADRRMQSTNTSDVIKITSGPSGHGFAGKPSIIGILKR